jgi:8-oxo-dGTP pyrophosphatase MutT (NUDIX family)
MEMVDVLKPPTFEKSGVVKTMAQGIADEDWLGGFNLWILQTDPVPSIVYQQRNLDAGWAPGKLDVTAGGHYSAGESTRDGIREVEEELGRTYDFADLTVLGRKLNVDYDTKGRVRNAVVDLFFVVDNSSIESYVLQVEEVYAVCVCPLSELLKVHADPDYSFVASGVSNQREAVSLRVSADSFPYNWDRYHYKIALLAQRFFNGETHLIY